MSSNFNKFTIQKSFAISAGAGSGKTYTLSRRYINAVLGFDFFTDNTNKTKKEDKQSNFIENKDKNKAVLSQIVTMTYTEAAALEMKERIFDLMEKIIEFKEDQFDINDKERDKDLDSVYFGMKELKDSDKNYVKTTLQTALQNSNDAFISTIHSFCLDTISSNSDIAKLDARLKVVQDDEKQNILSSAKMEALDSDESFSLSIFKQNDRFKVNQLIEKYATNSKFRESFDKFIEKSLDVNTYRLMIKELYSLPEVSQDVYAELDEVRAKWLEEYIDSFENFDAKSWGKLKSDLTPVTKAPSLGAKYPKCSEIKNSYEELGKLYCFL